METRRFAIFTRINTALNCEPTEIMVMNVKALSNGGAEHKLLDNYSTVTNALAFDMETETAQMIPYLSRAKVFDIEDFDRRERKREAAIQEVIDEQIDDIDTVRAESAEIQRKKHELMCEIARLNNILEGNNDYILSMTDELKEFCEFFSMPPIHSEEPMIGIA